MRYVLLVIGMFSALVLALFFYRLPQAFLTWIFPNDYVYRFTVSVTIDGETYTGETVSGCRVQRSPFANALRMPSATAGACVYGRHP